MRAHWGMYANGGVDQGVLYNDDIQIWTLSEPLAEVEPEPASPYAVEIPSDDVEDAGAAPDAGSSPAAIDASADAIEPHEGSISSRGGSESGCCLAPGQSSGAGTWFLAWVFLAWILMHRIGVRASVLVGVLGSWLVMLAAPSGVHACSCAIPADHLEAVLAHDIAFRGRVVRIESEPGASTAWVTFRVLRRYKLEPERLVTVRSHMSRMCPTPQFVRRAVFDVYATRDTDGAWLVSDCNPSMRIRGRPHAYAPRSLAESDARRLAAHLTERELARLGIRRSDGAAPADAARPEAWSDVVRRGARWVLRLSRVPPPAGLWAEVSFRRDGSNPTVRVSYSSR